MKLVIYFSIKTLKKLTVQALAPQGDEMSLVLTFAIRTVDQRVVSPLLCGSHPYPCGSLTYRIRVHSTPSVTESQVLFVKSFHQSFGDFFNKSKWGSYIETGMQVSFFPKIRSTIQNQFSMVMDFSMQILI